MPWQSGGASEKRNGGCSLLLLHELYGYPEAANGISTLEDVRVQHRETSDQVCDVPRSGELVKLVWRLSGQRERTGRALSQPPSVSTGGWPSVVEEAVFFFFTS